MPSANLFLGTYADGKAVGLRILIFWIAFFSFVKNKRKW
jgi:hypothetical protein